MSEFSLPPPPPLEQTFHPFPRLPTEIRLQIWQHAITTYKPRLVSTVSHLSQQFHYLSLLITCRESSSVILATHSLLFNVHMPGRKYFVDLERDVFSYSLLRHLEVVSAGQDGDEDGVEGGGSKQRGVRTVRISSIIPHLGSTFDSALPQLREIHPYIEVVIVTIYDDYQHRRKGGGIVWADQRRDFLKWLKSRVEPLAWGKKVNVPRREQGGGGRLKVLFDLSSISGPREGDAKKRWETLDGVQGEPEGALAETWEKWLN